MNKIKKVYIPKDKLRLISRFFYIIHKLLLKNYFLFFTTFQKHSFSETNIKDFIIPRDFLRNFSLDKYHKIIVKKYINHEFDLLGSGWCNSNYNLNKVGKNKESFSIIKEKSLKNKTFYTKKLNKANQSKSLQISKKISSSYECIDWHKDAKSNFRWSEKTWFRGIKFGHKEGCDIKFPWELSRLQHLPQLALYFNSLNIKSYEAKLIEVEIYDQILDFIAFNPPLYGVNWASTMDVAIRSVNILIAIYILPKENSIYWKKNKEIIISSFYDHAKFILKNLEWSENRGNHYLANICGLLCLSSLLPSTNETDKWLGFSVSEFNREVIYQFNEDGSNFEGSTGYHSLSLEMLLYSIIISLNIEKTRIEKVSKLNPNKYNFLPFYTPAPFKNNLHLNVDQYNKLTYSLFPNETLLRIAKACYFMKDCSDHYYKHPQIGDNDSGRFLNLMPLWIKISAKEAKTKFKYPNNFDFSKYYIYQDLLSTKHIIELASSVGIIKINKSKENSFFFQFGKILGRNKKFIFKSPENFYITKSFGKLNKLEKQKKEILKNKNKFNFQKIINLSSEVSNDKLTYKFYPDFGVHLWKKNDLFISLRSIQKDKIKIKSHFHDDQLSLNIRLKDKYLFRDYGSFIYTPFPKMRNLYRSRKTHFPLSYEPNTTKDPFMNLNIKSVKCIYSGLNGFAGIYSTEHSIDKIILHIEEKKLFILMSSQSRLKKTKKYNKEIITNTLNYSPGYGIIENKFD